MSNQELAIGIVSAGNISGVHAEAIHQAQGTRLSSIYSRSHERASELASKYDVKAFSDWQAFLAQEDMHAVSICSPSGLHLDHGADAAHAGKHVIVEKPIEVTLDRARELIAVCETRNVALAVIYQNRFLPDVKRLKAILDAGELGRIFLADAYVKWYRDDAYYRAGKWRGSFKLDGGGALINQAIHTLDLLQYLVGEIDSIHGHIGTFTHEGIEGEDCAVATVRFKDGTIGVIEASTSVQPAQSRRMEIHGAAGTAILDGDTLRIQTTANPSGNASEAHSSGADSPMAGMTNVPHREQFEKIAGAIRSGKTPPVSGQDSLISLAMVHAIYASSKSGKPVQLDDLLQT